MASAHRVIIGMLILQMYVHAAPSDISKLEDIAKVEHADVNSEIKQEDSQDDTKTQGARQKRYFNYYGYGYPPINPLIYPNFDKRDSTPENGGYGYDDPFVQIHRKLQEIANVVRQPAPPPPPPHIPIFLPVVFIPQAGCQCSPASTNPPRNPPVDTNQTKPDVVNRFPEMDDDRQNWGFAVNEDDAADDDYDDSDGSRPISFDPIRVNKTLNKPAPPVEHGSVQSAAPVTTTTKRPTTGSGFISVTNLGAPAPSTCDGAVLSCCHQLAVTYDCFAVQGCPDPTSYGNPCAADVILKVIDKFQRYYGQRNG